MTTGIDSSEFVAYADLVLRCGVNLDAGQKLLLIGNVEHSELIGVLAERAYTQGAAVVQVVYRDDRVLRAQAAGAPSDELAGYVPPWFVAMIDTTIEERWATVVTIGDALDDPFAGAPAQRVSALLSGLSSQNMRQLEARLNWNVCPCPTPGWAQRVYGTPDLMRLWHDLRFMLRLDEPDPQAAWEARSAELAAQAKRVNEARFAAIRIVGGQTDLHVPLHPGAGFMPARFVTSWGRSCLVNLPTEEIFTTPDFRGVQGVAAATRPVLVNGVTVADLVLRFEDGRIAEVKASANADAVEAQITEDPGAARLGELALVDGSSRVGRLDRVFKEILIDENATCHIAWGDGYLDTFTEPLPADATEREALGVNKSRIHQDAMIGGPQVEVIGVTAGGEQVPILVDERWQL